MTTQPVTLRTCMRACVRACESHVVLIDATTKFAMRVCVCECWSYPCER
jgi:hypothetical protein